MNMPLLYGEGAEKAFLRLQMEIIKHDNDESIFAWKSAQEVPTSLLATHPRHFSGSGSVTGPFRRGFDRPPFSMTNKGLEIAVPREHIRYPWFTLVLDCSWEDSELPLTVQFWRPAGDSSIACRVQLSQLSPLIESGRESGSAAKLCERLRDDFKECEIFYVLHHI